MVSEVGIRGDIPGQGDHTSTGPELHGGPTLGGRDQIQRAAPVIGAPAVPIVERIEIALDLCLRRQYLGHVPSSSITTWTCDLITSGETTTSLHQITMMQLHHLQGSNSRPIV
jgi:hypothetical protein